MRASAGLLREHFMMRICEVLRRVKSEICMSKDYILKYTIGVGDTMCLKEQKIRLSVITHDQTPTMKPYFSSHLYPSRPN
jgi:hypothetical protein